MRSIGSDERKRYSNIALVRRLRSFAWINARRFPGVRCSTLKTRCRSLLCLMIMPGRIWVAGMAIRKSLSLLWFEVKVQSAGCSLRIYCHAIGSRFDDANALGEAREPHQQTYKFILSFAFLAAPAFTNHFNFQHSPTLFKDNEYSPNAF